MMGRHQPAPPKNQESHRFKRQSERTAENNRLKQNSPPGRVDIIALVRSLQRTAGRTDCFRRGNVDCDMIDCDWRTYCLGTPPDRDPDTRRPKQNSD
jgi:hypothetical protein